MVILTKFYEAEGRELLLPPPPPRVRYGYAVSRILSSLEYLQFFSPAYNFQTRLQTFYCKYQSNTTTTHVTRQHIFTFQNPQSPPFFSSHAHFMKIPSSYSTFLIVCLSVTIVKYFKTSKTYRLSQLYRILSFDLIRTRSTSGIFFS